MAHIHGFPDNEKDHLNDLLGRGNGDPDVYGYPGQEAATTSRTRAQELEEAKQVIEQFAKDLR